MSKTAASILGLMDKLRTGRQPVCYALQLLTKEEAIIGLSPTLELIIK